MKGGSSAFIHFTGDQMETRMGSGISKAMGKISGEGGTGTEVP